MNEHDIFHDITLGLCIAILSETPVAAVFACEPISIYADTLLTIGKGPSTGEPGGVDDSDDDDDDDDGEASRK